MDFLLDKAKEVDKMRPDLKSFEDIYSNEEIEQDNRKVEEYEVKWTSEKSNYEKFVRDFSSIYESSVVDILHTNKFLGEGNEVLPTSKYDDIFNGVDGVFVINQKDQSEYLGLCMDVTFSSTDSTLEKKIESIKQCIRIGILPSLKYFQDPNTKEHKKISLPKIIIGSQQSSADGLVRLWGETKKENSNEKLKNHPIQSKIIMEALTQLMYFYKFAKNLSENTKENNMRDKYNDICFKYGQMYNYFYDIYLSKKDLIESHYNEVKKDTVYEKLVGMMGHL
jgi:hypothetical protein